VPADSLSSPARRQTLASTAASVFTLHVQHVTQVTTVCNNDASDRDRHVHFCQIFSEREPPVRLSVCNARAHYSGG